MGRPINLADPTFEPSDEELIELSTRAFAGVRESMANEATALRARVEEARRAVLESLQR